LKPHLRLMVAVGCEISTYAPVAQWIEHQTSNLGVAGSSPARGTTIFTHSARQYVRVV
jgi:hypothetical protein